MFHLRRNSASLIQTVGLSVDAVLASGPGCGRELTTEVLTLFGLVAVLAFAAPLGHAGSVLTLGVVLLVPLVATRRMTRRFGAEPAEAQQSAAAGFCSRASPPSRRSASWVSRAISNRAFGTRRTQLGALQGASGCLDHRRARLRRNDVRARHPVRRHRGDGPWRKRRPLDRLDGALRVRGFRVVPSANRLLLNFGVFQGARPHLAGALRRP